MADRKYTALKWNNWSDKILIGGKRFSGGGMKTLHQLLAKIKSNSTVNQKFKFEQLRGYYKYCNFFTYRGMN